MAPPSLQQATVARRTDLREFDARLRLLALLFGVGLSFLVMRLWNLQVVKGEDYHQMASRNFVRDIEQAPDRGRMYDIRGRLVAENRPSYDIYVTPHLIRGNEEALTSLMDIAMLSEEQRARVNAQVNSNRRADVLVDRDASRDTVARVETQRGELPGVYVRVIPRRHYPYNQLAAHLLGYMNEIQASELDRWEGLGYHAGDFVGRTGLERAFQQILRGVPGLERQVVDVRGQVQDEQTSRELLGDYRFVPSQPGKDVHLTIDMDLQRIVEEAASDYVSGGIVALDPRDGSVLAMFSKPGFNPNAWSGRLSAQEQRLSDNNPFHPMIDKSISSWFPGSTWKVITAMAALEEGLADEDFSVECPGYFEYGDRRFHCWNRGGHGEVNLDEAMAQSCDVYFYQLGLQLGMDRLATYANEFGFGERPGLGISGESAGVVPTRAWHEANSPGGFQYGFTVNTSVGQGDTRISPLQLSLAYAALANGGTLYYPRIVDSITNVEGAVLFEYPPRVRRELPFSEEHMNLVVDSLVSVLHGESGTAAESQLPYVESAGKTGTAQVRSLESVRLENGEVIFRDRDHAWFVAFAPVENPQVVVSVFLEHGGAGSSNAAPVAMEVVDRYFREVLGWDESIEVALREGTRGELEALLGSSEQAPVGYRDEVSTGMDAEFSVPLFHVDEAEEDE